MPSCRLTAPLVQWALLKTTSTRANKWTKRVPLRFTVDNSNIYLKTKAQLKVPPQNLYFSFSTIPQIRYFFEKKWSYTPQKLPFLGKIYVTPPQTDVKYVQNIPASPQY